VLLAAASVVETFPMFYYRDLHSHDYSVLGAPSTSERAGADSNPAERRYPGDGLESEDDSLLDRRHHLHEAMLAGAEAHAGSARMHERRSSDPPRLSSDLIACSAPLPRGGAAPPVQLRASPVTTGANGGVGSGLPPSHGGPVRPWSLALHSRSVGAASLGQWSGQASKGAAGHSRQRSGEVRFAVRPAHERNPNMSRVPSHASSMISLDSLAVD